MLNFEKNLDALKNTQEVKKVIENPVVKGFTNIAKAVPSLNFGIEALDTMLNNRFENKLKLVLDEIINGDEIITPEMLQDIDVISSFLQMMEAVKRTQVNEKIIIFARLFKNFILSENSIKQDEYEEYLNVLSELSFREIDILMTYHNHMNHCKEVSNIFESTTYQSFKCEIFSRYLITEAELTDILTRMQNKGLCVFYMGHSYNDVNIKTFSTAYFEKLALRISGETIKSTMNN